MPHFGKTVRRIYSKISRPRHAPPVQDAATLPTIFRTPVEILHYIGSSDALSIADKAALTLTCKAFWVILDGRELLKELKQSSREERLSLLERMEVWFPKHLLSFRAVAFVPRPRPWRYRCMTMKNHQDVCLRIPFFRLQEVANHHRFGKKYGRSAKDLGVSMLRSGYEFSVSAAIYDDELLLKTEVSFLFSVQKNEETAEQVDPSRDANAGEPVTPTVMEKFYKCSNCSREFRWVANPLYCCGIHSKIRCTVLWNMGACSEVYKNENNWHALTCWSCERTWRVAGGTDPERCSEMKRFEDAHLERPKAAIIRIHRPVLVWTPGWWEKGLHAVPPYGFLPNIWIAPVGIL